MAIFTLSRSLLLLLLALLSLFSRILTSEATSLSFSFTSSDKNVSFASDDIALYGDAKLVDGGSLIQLNDSASQGSGGLVVYKKPTLSVDTESDYFTGFSTVFSFSLSLGHGGRIGFVMFPANGKFDHSFFQVKFDMSENFTKFRDSNVTVIVDGSMVSETISNLTIVYSEKERLLYAWINYEANSYSLHVRLSKDEHFNSDDSLYIRWIDFKEDGDEFMVGLKSYSGNFNLHSWKLGAAYSPKFEHSHLLIDESKHRQEEKAARHREEEEEAVRWKIVTCLVMTFGFTGLVFFAMMGIWVAFKRSNLAMLENSECGLKTKQMEYEKKEKMEVVMSKAERK